MTGLGAARVITFLAVMVASQMTIVWLLAGDLTDTANDPLWVGPLSAALALLNTIGTHIAALMLSESWRSDAGHNP